MTASSHQTVRLARGRHHGPEDGVCVMELASMLAGEPFTDSPRSVCPVLGCFLLAYNDLVDDDRRQDLYWAAAAVVGTRADRRTEGERARLCVEQLEQTPGFRRPRILWRHRHTAAEAARVLALGGADRHRQALELLRRMIAAGCDRAAGPTARGPSPRQRISQRAQ